MKLFSISLAIVLIASAGLAFADDGFQLVVPVSNQSGVPKNPEPEGEHAFIKLMNFHVPSQKADGTRVSVKYFNIDHQHVVNDPDGATITKAVWTPLSPTFGRLEVEGSAGRRDRVDIRNACTHVVLFRVRANRNGAFATIRQVNNVNAPCCIQAGVNGIWGPYIEVDNAPNDCVCLELVKTENKAKPLINVYDYGPVIRFDDPSQVGFPGHGRRDAFGAVSLDDGKTWKVTNLSNSANISSYVIKNPIPDPGLFVINDPNGATINTAVWTQVNPLMGRLEVTGTAESSARVEIRNACTHEVLFRVRSKRDGAIILDRPLANANAPCYVQAGVDGIWGPYIEVDNAPANCKCPFITDYPGDVTNIHHAVAGNRVLVAWQSKFCASGFPGYALDGNTKDAVATFLGINNETDLYLTDLFSVDGSQQSVDYRSLATFPGAYDEVGEVPYNCLWSARGVLRENPNVPGTTDLVWFQAERLTSGQRDVNRIETDCVAGAGCAITWQEDPGGQQPEAAGISWSGATTSRQTDIWYSFIEWEDMDIIENNGVPQPLANIVVGARPQPYVPMMVPARLTNNARCPFPALPNYCDVQIAAPYGIKDQCIDIVEIPLGPQQSLFPICVGDIPNVGNTAASRPRLNLQPRDRDNDGVTDDAWVIIAHEEDKGLGRFGFPNNEEWDLGDMDDGVLDDIAVPCGDPDASLVDNCEADIGKNIWWHTFVMGTPETSVASYNGINKEATLVDFSLVNNLLGQGNILNQPEVNWRTRTFYKPMNTADMWDFRNSSQNYNYLIFNTEIAQQARLMTQPLDKAQASTKNLVAMPLWKQGTLSQAGPADIMGRRFVIDPATVDETTENPYDFANLQCEWYDGEGTTFPGVMFFDDGSNPYYPKGLCMVPAINLSARTPYTCEPMSDLSDGVCPGASNMFCVIDPNFGQLCVIIPPGNDPNDLQMFDKLVSWYQCPGSKAPTCYTEPDSVLLMSNLDDQSWYMPLEIARAHSGFLDGDFVSLIYAWSPNYKLNAVGMDRYELYTRRSFDGGVTWTTTPSSFVASDGVTYAGNGTTTCETWRDGASHVCTEYTAGEWEQSRNLSQIISMRGTISNAVITSTIPSMPNACPGAMGSCNQWLIFEPIEPTDVRNPSRHFIVFETADNTTTVQGEPEPMNLYYGRAEMFGDHFTVWAETDTASANLNLCYPWGWVDMDFCNEFDTLEGLPNALSKEASITSSAYGDFLYGVWGQFNVNTSDLFVDGDAMFRRVWYLDDYISNTSAWIWDLPPGP